MTAAPTVLAREIHSVRDMLASGPVVIPAVSDALSAKLAEKAGCRAVYLSLDALARSLGLAHPALLTLTEYVEEARLVVDAVSVPVICDAGDGFGNYLNARRTVRLLGEFGAAGVALSDGHPNAVIEPDEMAGKIAAALDARPTSDLFIIAAVSATTRSEADGRAEAYERVGAEALLVAEPTEERRVPLLALFPSQDVTISEPHHFAALGFSAVVDTRLQAVAAEGLRGLLKHLNEVGTVTDRLDRMVTTAFVTELLGLPDLRRLEQVFGRDSGSTWTPW